MPTHNEHGAHCTSLTATIRQLGLVIPKAVEAEVETYRNLSRQEDVARHQLEAAKFRLTNAQPEDIEVATEQVLEKAARLAALATGADRVLVDVATTRLFNQVFDAVPVWEEDLVSRFNEVVDHYELNAVAGDLPDFSNPGSFNVLTLGTAQGRAIERWREAAIVLQPMWTAFHSLADFRDHLLGPIAADLSTNLLTACVLGDPGTGRKLQRAADVLSRLGAGGNQMRAWAPLSPFIAPALAGYELRLRSMSGAAIIRAHLNVTAA